MIADADILSALSDAETSARVLGEPVYVVVDELRGRVFASRTKDPRSYRVLETIRPSTPAEYSQ